MLFILTFFISALEISNSFYVIDNLTVDFNSKNIRELIFKKLFIADSRRGEEYYSDFYDLKLLLFHIVK